MGEYTDIETGTEGGGSSQPSSSGTRKRVHSEDQEDDDILHGDRGERESRPQWQTTLPARVSLQMWVKERQRVVEMEIARTPIECNVSFNVLRTVQWKRMV